MLNSRYLAAYLVLKEVIVLITPPFTQLNTPYPATAYIKGFLNTRQIHSHQFDLGLEVILTLFSRTGLERLFQLLEEKYENLTEGQKAIVDMQDAYMRSIDPVIRFLQHEDPTLGYALAAGDFLPQGPRFQQLEELDWAFGQVGIQDKARHFATLFLEDLSDLITQAVDPYFGFSRYAERLSRSASSFSGLLDALQAAPTFIDQLLFERLALHEQTLGNATLVCLSVPFPGNLYSALRIGQYLKRHFPTVKVAMGGGYPNTELRRLSDPRVFDFLDYVTLDDGERPLLQIYGHALGQVEHAQLKRTFLQNAEGQVEFIDSSEQPDFPFTALGTPDYSDLRLRDYLGVIAWTNPMHRMWSDGRWNKLTMAHGCYWKKCSFCDISLPYIQDYSPLSASLLVDRMEELITATGTTGFHFVDEAAPPALMRELALEILRRGLICTWWTNIRFESRFSYDLCRLLKASGCIAVSGGLEVASDRLLEKMQKGVTVAQVARVARNFTASGIMVHAYLMYGFPTQTAQETVDSLEMVRQLFGHGVLQSGFWHQFAMTAHAPVGLTPEDFGVAEVGPVFAGFADNDRFHEDPSGAAHERFGPGLSKALYNYMHGHGLDFPLSDWFDFKVPRSSVSPEFIYDALESEEDEAEIKPSTKIVYIGHPFRLRTLELPKGRRQALYRAQLGSGQVELNGSPELRAFMEQVMPLCAPGADKKSLSWSRFQAACVAAGIQDFDAFTESEAWMGLLEAGLLLL